MERECVGHLGGTCEAAVIYSGDNKLPTQRVHRYLQDDVDRVVRKVPKTQTRVKVEFMLGEKTGKLKDIRSYFLTINVFKVWVISPFVLLL